MLSGTSAGEAWSLQRSRTTSLGGGVLTIPGDAPASPPATTTLNTHAILLGASSLTSAAVRIYQRDSSNATDPSIQLPDGWKQRMAPFLNRAVSVPHTPVSDTRV